MIIHRMSDCARTLKERVRGHRKRRTKRRLMIIELSCTVKENLPTFFRLFSLEIRCLAHRKKAHHSFEASFSRVPIGNRSFLGYSFRRSELPQARAQPTLNKSARGESEQECAFSEERMRERERELRAAPKSPFLSFSRFSCVQKTEGRRQPSERASLSFFVYRGPWEPLVLLLALTVM